MHPAALILSGGPASVYTENALRPILVSLIWDSRAGHLLWSSVHGADLAVRYQSADIREYGKTSRTQNNTALFRAWKIISAWG